MMRDIASMVAETSPMIANIEEAVAGTNDNIVAGNNQLASALGHQVNRFVSHRMLTLISFFRKNIGRNSVCFYLSC